MSRILLIQADGSLPNLALMKLSAYHKIKGDEVVLMRGISINSRLSVPDKVFISCIFEKNGDSSRKLAKQFPHSEVHLGGSGIDFETVLPDEIEHIMPDYDLFDCGYSIGFTSRGCFRVCPFCIVPKKEGNLRAVADIYEFWDRRHDHIVLQDNNILGLPEHFKKIALQIKENRLSVDFNQGLDIRLIDDENAAILADLKVKPNLRFSWDNKAIEDKVLAGIETLRGAGIRRSQFFVLSGFDSIFDEDLYKLNKLREWGQRAYLMRYEAVRGWKKYNDLAAWANQPAFFMKTSFEDFCQLRSNRSKKRKHERESID